MGASEPAISKKDTAQNVVDTALKAIEHNKSYTVPGPLSNYILTQAVRFAPRALTSRLSEMLLRRRKT